MKRLSVAILTGTVVLLASLAWTTPAQAYPQPPSPHVHAAVKAKVVVGGATVAANVRADVRCHWTMRFLSQSATGSGRSFAPTFTTPKVKRRTTYPLRWSCAFSGGSSVRGTAGQGLMPSAQVQSGTLSITVLPRGVTAATRPAAEQVDHGVVASSSPAFWVLLAGLVLLVGGGAATIAGRRRHTVG